MSIIDFSNNLQPNPTTQIGPNFAEQVGIFESTYQDSLNELQQLANQDETSDNQNNTLGITPTPVTLPNHDTYQGSLEDLQQIANQNHVSYTTNQTNENRPRISGLAKSFFRAAKAYANKGNENSLNRAENKLNQLQNITTSQLNGIDPEQWNKALTTLADQFDQFKNENGSSSSLSKLKAATGSLLALRISFKSVP